jgi:hypothetical protein
MTESSGPRKGFSTRAIHHAYDPYAGHGSLNPPVYLSSTYTFPTVEDGAARFAGEQAGFVYSRVGNPTTHLLEQRIADLEGGEAAVVTALGRAPPPRCCGPCSRPATRSSPTRRFMAAPSASSTTAWPSSASKSHTLT